MNKKLCIALFCLFQMCFAGFAFAENSEWVKIGENVKTSTYGNVIYYDKKLSKEEAVQVNMYFARSFENCTFNVSSYSKKEFSKTKDFSDSYIYGSAIKGITESKYGIVSIDYFESEDEPVNIAGWDSMYLLRLKDDSILCVKVIKNNTYYANEISLDKDENVLILRNSEANYEMRIYLYENSLDKGKYQVFASDKNPNLEAVVYTGNDSADAKTKLFIEYYGSKILVYGKAVLNDVVGPYGNHVTVKFCYDGNF